MKVRFQKESQGEFQDAKTEQTWVGNCISKTKLTQRWLLKHNYNIVEFKECKKIKKNASRN